MIAQKAVIHEKDFLLHFGLQNSMVHEFLKDLRFIVQKYVTKYQLFSILRRYVGYHCNSLAVNYKCIIRILTVFQKNTKKRYRTDSTDSTRCYSASGIVQNRIALNRNRYEKLKNRHRSFASVSLAVVDVLFCEHFIWKILSFTHL